MPNYLFILTEQGDNDIGKYSTSVPSVLSVCTDAFGLNVDGVVPALSESKI